MTPWLPEPRTLMTTLFCLLTWLVAAFSDRNQSGTLALISFFALLSSCTGM